MPEMDTNTFNTIIYSDRVWAIMSPDVKFAGFSVELSVSTLRREYPIRVRYQQGAWMYWDGGWFPIAGLPAAAGITITFVGGDPALLDPDFSEVEIGIRKAGTYTDVDPAWPEISDLGSVTVRVMRGILSDTIRGSKAACVNAEGLLNSNNRVPFMALVDRTVRDLADIESFTSELIGSALQVTFTTYSGATDTVVVEVA